MPRKSTVLTAQVVPPKPKAPKPEPAPTERPWTPSAGREYRVVPAGSLGPPRSWPRPASYHPDAFSAELDAAGWDIPALVQVLTPAGYVPHPIRPPVLVEHLAMEGLARDGGSADDDTAGEGGATKGGTRWRIMPEGYRRIHAAMGLHPQR